MTCPDKFKEAIAMRVFPSPNDPFDTNRPTKSGYGRQKKSACASGLWSRRAHGDFSSLPTAPCLLPSGLSITTNESIGRTVMPQAWLFLAFKLRDDAFGQHLPQLHAPLIESINV